MDLYLHRVHFPSKVYFSFSFRHDYELFRQQFLSTRLLNNFFCELNISLKNYVRGICMNCEETN